MKRTLIVVRSTLEGRRAKAGLVIDPAARNRRLDLLQVRIYHDELALGLTCNGEIARAARERAHAACRIRTLESTSIGRARVPMIRQAFSGVFPPIAQF